MEKKRLKDLTSDEYDISRLATDHLLRTNDIHKMEMIYMTEEEKSWNFLYEYTSKYDKPKSRKIKRLIIPVMKVDNSIGRAINPDVME